MTDVTKILELLQENSKITTEEISILLGLSEENVKNTITELESKNIIFGYKALIDWDKLHNENVSALIELKVTPQEGEGFDSIARNIVNECPDVTSVYLISGGFDLLVEIEGKNMKKVALFVAEKLAPMDCIVSTATHFVLKRYKQDGKVLINNTQDERRMITL